MPRPAFALLVLVLLAGCDALSGPDGPPWAQDGARLVYDYVPGPDSLRYGPVFPRRALGATPGIAEMRVGGVGAYGGVPVNWSTTTIGQPRYDAYYGLPLNGQYITATERGVEVVIPTGCQGGLLSPAGGSTHYVRVPRVAGDSQAYVPCSLSPSVNYRVAGTETVVTPAGTFETYVFESPSYDEGEEGVAREFWNYDVGLVRYDLVNAEGVLRGRLVLASGTAGG